MRKERLNFEAENIVCIDAILKEFKSIYLNELDDDVLIEDSYWVSKITDFNTAKDYKRTDFGVFKEQNSYYFNLKGIKTDDLISAQILKIEYEPKMMGLESDTHFIVDEVDENGISILVFNTMYEGVKYLYKNQ